MIKHFSDYYWKDGKPCGIGAVDPATSLLSYKIVTDPYFKWISIEKYHYVQFDGVIYDSQLLNFRRLTESDQTAWQREVLHDDQEKITSLLRNQDDRAILIETMFFENERCRQCITSSTHGIKVSTHRMYYRVLGDLFDGVILYDTIEKQVMKKTYACDPHTGEFTNLLAEQWDHSIDCTVHRTGLY